MLITKVMHYLLINGSSLFGQEMVQESGGLNIPLNTATVPALLIEVGVDVQQGFFFFVFGISTSLNSLFSVTFGVWTH